MKMKRHKLRLRKQAIIAIPIALFIAVLTIGLIIGIGNSKTLSKEVNKNEVLSSNNQNQEGLSDLDYFSSLSKVLEERQKDNTIIYYANTFKLNVPETLRIAKQYTNNYEDEEFNKTFIIGPAKVKNKLGSLKNFEAGVVYFVRDLYRYPERYGTTIETIRTSEEPTLKQKASDGKIYMDNGLTFEQYLGKICDLFEIDKTFTMSIVNLESGNKSSNLFKYSNNIGGHRGYNGWMKYTTLEAGIIAHVLSVKAIADNNGIDIKEATVEEIASFSGVYVNGKITKPSSSWTGKVLNIEENIRKKDLFSIKE